MYLFLLPNFQIVFLLIIKYTRKNGKIKKYSLKPTKSPNMHYKVLIFFL